MPPGAQPARQGAVTVAAGRRLAYSEFGPVDGRPVVLLHGSPGSRLICPDVDATEAAGVRLVTVDRPGFGGSDPDRWHRLGDVADDLDQLLDHLGLPVCPVLGWSAGAAYALAVGARHPDRVTAIGLVSGSGAADDPATLAQHTPAIQTLFERLRAHDDDAFDEVLARFAFYAEDPHAIITRTLADDQDPDRPLMADPTIQAALATMWEEGARQGAEGVAAAWVAQYALPWGFAPEDLRVEVTSWHGTHDRIVPFELAERLVARLPTARLHAYPGEGHLPALQHWTEILAGV
jgi:pimeloyl-ACP methyl ester carboxylesterase